MVRRSTNLVVTRTLRGCLTELLRKSLDQSISLNQLVQVTINVEHIERCCEQLDEHIARLSESDNASASTLSSSTGAKWISRTVFAEIARDAEQQLYEKLNQKLDEFLELAKRYDWMCVESKGNASSYVMDLVACLQSSILSFHKLPPQLCQGACIAACSHLAHSLSRVLFDVNVRQVSFGALQQFNLDVAQCEQFANSEPVPGVDNDRLRKAFVDLRQLLDLFLNWDWVNYLEEYGKESSRYNRVEAQDAITLLEKVRAAENRRKVFTSLKKNERDKKRIVENVLKQLKSLDVAATTTA